VGIVVEESEEFVLEFREFLITRESSIVFQIIVKEMDGFWFEKLS
jgi:hypothetical protein